MAAAGLAAAQGVLAGHSIAGPVFKDALHSHRSLLLCKQPLAGIGSPTLVPCAALGEDRRLGNEAENSPVFRRERMGSTSRWDRKARRPSWVVAAQAAEQAQSDAADRCKQREENRAHLMAHREETHEMEELERPLAEYMSLPASQYSVLDAQRIERVDEKTFKCYVHRLKFFTFEVCPVLLVRVDEKPNGCSIRLLSCTLEGSPLVVAQNEKFSASMVNNVRWSDVPDEPTRKQLISDTTIDVSIEVPAPFRRIPVEGIEVTGRRVLQQLLRLVLPRFLLQLEKDYRAWASGDESRKPLGTGEL